MYVDSVHTYLVNPESPYNNIVDGCDSFGPCVVAFGFVEHQMAGTNRVAREVLPSEL